MEAKWASLTLSDGFISCALLLSEKFGVILYEDSADDIVQ